MARTFDTREYETANAGRKPRGWGQWGFATRAAVNAAKGTGEPPEGIEWRTGTFTEARAQMPAGDWMVLS